MDAQEDMDVNVTVKEEEVEDVEETTESSAVLVQQEEEIASPAVVKEESVDEDLVQTDVKEEEEIIDDDGLLEDDCVNGIEPGELPTLNEGNPDSGDMDVLEAILGDETKDDFDEEIDAPTTTTAKKANTAKRTPKRKSTRKTKATKKTESPAPEKSQVVTTNNTAAESKQKDSAETSQPESSQMQTETPGPQQTPTNKKVKRTVTPKAKSTSIIPTSEQKENSTMPKKTAAVKSAKKKKTTKKAVAKKEVKKVEAKPAEVDEQMPSEETLETAPEEMQEEALEKKVKELEKLVKSASPKVESADVAPAETDNKQKAKKEKSKGQSSERKRKGSETTANKDGKVKKGKTKAENTVDGTTQAVEAAVEKEEANAVTAEDDQSMKVIDGFSDNDSHYSATRSRSHSFSHSISGSFSDGSFSVTLSSFSGSHASLDSLDKELGDEEKQKKKHRKKHTSSEKAAEHKDQVNNILKGARYFIIKSNNYENVALSKAKGVWATPPANERKLNDAFRHSTNVILVFSVKESGRFQGFARLSSESKHDGIPVPWVLPPGFDRRILGGTFKVDWLNRKEVTFSKCANLRNPWNENKEVKICRDGQELEPSVGEVLCRMFDDDLTVNIERIVRHAKRYKAGAADSHHKGGDRFRGGRGEWRGRGGFRGGFRGGRGGRGRGGGGGDFQRRDDFRRRGGSVGRFREERGGARRRDHQRDERRPVGNDFQRQRSRSPEYNHHRRYERDNRDNRDHRDNRDNRDNRDRRHKDRVKEFLKEDRSKYGIREETLLHGSYSDYVREFHRQKEVGNHRSSSSSYYGTSYPSSSGRYDANAASAEEFLRRGRR